MTLTQTLSQSRGAHFALRVLAVTLLLIGGFALKGHPVSAATTNGTATITDPGSAQALASGGSAAVFTVALPAQAACSGDTQNGGYHVYSYLVPKGTNVGSLTFVNSPSAGLGLFDVGGGYYGAANTAATTGQVISIPNNLTFGILVTNQITTASALTAGQWEAGLVCANTTGNPTDWWNTEVTFTANGADANGFTWAATPGGGVTPTSPTTTVPKGRVTTTTKPKSTATSTTLGGDPVTTTTVSGATTTTVFVSGSGVTPIVPVDATGSDFSDPTAVSGTLPRTGSPVSREVGLGLLAIGAGMMIIGLEWRWKARGALAT
jgi:hypothetical protein